MEQQLDQWIGQLVDLAQHHFWFAPLLTITAGILTSLTPCSLASIPLIMGYVDRAGQPDFRRCLRYSLVFAGGSVVALATLGALVSFIGHVLHPYGVVWYLIIGAVMLVMGLQTMELIEVLPHTEKIERSGREGLFGAFLTGVLGGIFASHCALPVMIVLLAIIADSGWVSWGVLIMTLFAVGHSLFIVMAGTWTGLMNRLTRAPQYEPLVRAVRIALGLIILLLAAYMFYLAWQTAGG